MKYKIYEELISILDESLHSYIEIINNSNKDPISFGDYSTNIALKLAKKQQKNPLELAEQIAKQIQDKSKMFDKVEVMKPGFINFFIKNDYVLEQLIQIADERFKPEFKFIDRDKYNFEYVSANPTGYLHIGHARNAIIGDVVTSVMKYLNQDVYLEYYINDYGNQIDGLTDSVFYYYDQFIESDPRVEEAPYKGKEIKEFAKKLYEEVYSEYKEHSEQNYSIVKEKSLNYFLDVIKETLLKLNVKPFNEFVSEKSLYDNNKVEKVLSTLIANNKTYIKDKALWLKTTEYGDDKDRVLKKEDGNYTYLVGDIANHYYKVEKGFNNLIDLWGKDHHGYETRVKASLSFLGYDDVLTIDYIDMVQITSNGSKLKMSKRAGTSLTILDMLEIMNVNELRYFILSKNKEQNLEIDIEKAQEHSSTNPYFYMQYANARVNQLINKVDQNDLNNWLESFKQVKDFKKLLNSFKELQLAKKLTELEEVLINVFKQREPMVLITYLKELANLFHSFYNNCKVISDDELLTRERFFLVKAFKNTIEIVLKLLGIEPTKEM